MTPFYPFYAGTNDVGANNICPYKHPRNNEIQRIAQHAASSGRMQCANEKGDATLLHAIHEI